MTEQTAIVSTSTQVNGASLEDLMKLGEQIAESNIAPAYDTPAKVVACILWAKENGVSYMNALLETVAINGKVGATTKLQRAIVMRAGIIHELIEDFIPMYDYETKDNVFSYDVVMRNRDKFAIYENMAFLQLAAQKKEIPTDVIVVVQTTTPVDFRTTIRFSRTLHGKELTMDCTFLYSEAVNLGLTIKDNWIKQPRNMMYARAYGRGVTRFAADAVQGCYNKEEIAPDEAAYEAEFEMMN